MIKAFRLCVLRRFVPCVKMAECRERHFVHVAVHKFPVIQEQCFDEIVVCSPSTCAEPAPHHFSEHSADFIIRDCKGVPDFLLLVTAFHIRDPQSQHFQIAGCHQQAPDCLRVATELAEHDLLIDPRLKAFSSQKILHRPLDAGVAFLYQCIDQTVSACV